MRDLRIYVPTFMEEHNFVVPFILSTIIYEWALSMVSKYNAPQPSDKSQRQDNDNGKAKPHTRAVR